MTSSGEYVIAWDFAQAKKGRTDRYEIKKYVPSLHFTAMSRHVAAARYMLCNERILTSAVRHLFSVCRYEDAVVQDNFKFGDDKEIVRPPSFLASLLLSIFTVSRILYCVRHPRFSCTLLPIITLLTPIFPTIMFPTLICIIFSTFPSCATPFTPFTPFQHTPRVLSSDLPSRASDPSDAY